ncbi:MAG: hypothetical protein GXP24_08015 [Planctomycetes bacterium]|nr:hypothetical protein [Planctomycetota bacterium]
MARVRPAQQPQRLRIVHDAQVVAAAWEADDVLAVQHEDRSAEDRSVVVERTQPSYDPFDEDDRLALLSDEDPFDEPVGESIPAPEQDDAMEDDLDTVEDAVEAEIQRRQAADDLFEEEMEDPLDHEPLVEDLLKELGETDPLRDAPDDRDMLQPEKNNFDLGLDYDRDVREDDHDEEEEEELEELTAEELAEQRQELEKERLESEASCRDELEELASNRISSIDLGIRVDGNAGEDFPYECAVSSQNHQPRQWPQITYNWKAAALCHKPLYFEQVQLERYGHSWGPYVQPIMSGAHFFGTIPVLPYKMGIRTPNECVYTLGYYRPGSCAPYMIDPIPFTWRAALFEGGVATGISFVIP